MQKKFQQVEIGLASPKQIREWAERELPNGEIVGEVTSWETVNYKTLKPEPNGLFCQRIFGPVIDYTCACSKKSNKVYMGFCLKCGVEKTTSRVRRYRLGYIKMKQPIVHTLYASHKPSPLSLCLDWSNKRIQAVMYGTEFCKLPPTFTCFVPRLQIDRVLYKKKQAFVKKKLIDNNLKTKKQRDNQQIFFKYSNTGKALFLEYNPIVPRFKKPKLFHSCNQPFKKRIKRSTQNLLYSITYDATWREVENLQKFLLFSSEQVKSYETSISYYDYLKLVKNNTITKIPYHKTLTWNKRIPCHSQFYPIQTGGFVFQKIFSHFELLPILQQMRHHHDIVKYYILYLQEKLKWYPLSQISSEDELKERTRVVKKLTRLKNYEKKYVKNIQYFRDFYNTDMKPAWMILSYLPVLPPGLRPIMSIQGELIVSDINSLYRKILTRNKRVHSFTTFKIFDTALSGSWASWCYNLRQVQEAVDSLFKTGSVESGKTTKSLLDSLKGKKGRFRQHLLGKRVDYSGRSVIVVGPNLKIYECGLPKQMAIELFQPFLIQKLRNKRIALTNTSAKAIISQKKPIIWSLLAGIMKNHPVLLNRAPTLHRLGIQAFLPRLVEGKAILLHPLVCPAFNADFDGDQMAVHIPLGAASRSEAFHLMWSRNHLLAPASGQPLLLPTQDMVLGCYYLTIAKNSKKLHYKTGLVERNNLSSSGYYFSTLNEVEQAYNQGILETHTPIWVRWFGKIQNFSTEHESKNGEQPIEFRLDLCGNSEFIFQDREFKKSNHVTNSFLQVNNLKNSTYIRTTPGRIYFHNKFPL